MVVDNDGNVRCVEDLQEAFGGDGIDPCKTVLDPNWLKRGIYRVKCAQAEDYQGKT